MTWLEKYYPVPANKVSVEGALSASILKWEGLQADVLLAYGLTLRRRHVYDADDQEVLTIDSETCGLCVHHISSDCAGCPLKEHLGRKCDAGGDSPYLQMLAGSTKPMLDALKASRR